MYHTCHVFVIIFELWSVQFNLQSGSKQSLECSLLPLNAHVDSNYVAPFKLQFSIDLQLHTTHDSGTQTAQSAKADRKVLYYNCFCNMFKFLEYHYHMDDLGTVLPNNRVESDRQFET